MDHKPITLPRPTQDQMDYLAMILKASEYDGSYLVGGPPKPKDDGRVPDRETFWLIERKCTPPQYTTDRSTRPMLSPDPWRAARYDTEREAHTAWLALISLRDECHVVEHMFINKP
jgi:hypothetical protein